MFYTLLKVTKPETLKYFEPLFFPGVSKVKMKITKLELFENNLIFFYLLMLC